MDTSRAKRLTAVLGCLLAGAGVAFADLHLVSTQTRRYESSPRTRSSTQEVWARADKDRRETDGRVRIQRQDLGLVWSIDAKAGTYTETPLGKAAAPADVEELHNEGYDYEPVFDWKLEDTGLEEEVAGVRCRKHVLDGDADLSEKVIELWTATDLGPSIPLDPRTIGFFLGRTEAGGLLERWEALKGRFVLKERVVENPPIGGTSILETAFTTFESAEPPAGIYDLPAGLKKVEPGEER
jgi:hypothetical protein